MGAPGDGPNSTAKSGQSRSSNAGHGAEPRGNDPGLPAEATNKPPRAPRLRPLAAAVPGDPWPMSTVRIARRHSWARPRRCALALTVLALLAACAPPLQLQQPDAGVPPPLLLSRTAPADEGDSRLVHWRQFFKDRRLHALIEAALAHNRDLRIAAARVEEARAQWALAKAERWPALQLNVQGTLQRSVPASLDTGPARRVDLGLTASSFEIDFFGRLASLSDAARANYLASAEARRAAELTLVAQIAELYHAQIQNAAQLERTRAIVASRARTVDVLQRARDIGLTHDFELAQAQVQLDTAIAQRAQLGHQQNQIDHLFHLLAGPLPATLPDGLPIEALVASTTLPAGLAADVLLGRPDIAAAEQRLLGAQADLKAARAAFFPRVTLTSAIGVASASLAGLFSAGAWAFQPTLTLPLFDGGRTEAQFDIARARERVVVADYERTVQQAFREVADQLSARESLAAQARAAERSLQAQQLRVQFARARHEGGMGSLLDVLDAERDLLAAEQAQVAAQRNQLDAVVGLYKALGGGGPEVASPPIARATRATWRTDGS